MITNQKELIDVFEKWEQKIDECKKKEDGAGKRKWTKLKGDICVRILKDYISKELPKNYKTSSPYAYVEGFPYEFDILIIKSSSDPLKYTNIHHPKDVRVCIEVKARGVYGGKKRVRETIQKIRNNFDSIKKKYPHIEFIYFTFEEISKPKRANSINYWNITKEEFSKGSFPYEVFCLRDSCTKEERDGWKNLVSYLKEIL